MDISTVNALRNRYRDAYLVSNMTTGLGSIIKVIGIVLALLLLIVTLIVLNQLGVAAGLAGAVLATCVGMFFYILGVLVSAQGQVLRASLDCAVNSSPLLTNVFRAEIMSLPYSQKDDMPKNEKLLQNISPIPTLQYGPSNHDLAAQEPQLIHPRTSPEQQETPDNTLLACPHCNVELSATNRSLRFCTHCKRNF